MNFINSKKVLLSSLILVVGLCGINVLGAIAGTFSIREISAQITRRTNVPILLPSEEVVEQNKFDASETIYAHLVNSSEYDYHVIFDKAPRFSNNAVFRFSISAKRGGDFEIRSQDSNPRYSPVFSKVKVHDNSNALVTSWCGGTACWSTVQWKSNGVLYKVWSKRRPPNTALAIANSAIREGNRSKR